MNDTGIIILLSSDSDYEKLTAEIYYDGKFIALLNQDNGIENLVIEFPSAEFDEERILRKIKHSTFEKCVEEAKRRLAG